MPTDPSTRAAMVRCLALLAAAVIVFELFYAGARPAAAGWLVQPWDKVAHFAAYSIIAALMWVATAGRMPFALIVLALLVGGLDELHQAGVPGRTADSMDFLADACAVAATIGVLSIWRRPSCAA
jgi:VanZ family protein